METLLYISAGVCTLAYVFLVIKSIRISEQNSIRRIMPGIVVITEKVYFMWNYHDSFFFPDIWSADPRNGRESDNRLLRIMNIGKGPAKDIQISWDFDVLTLANLIMESDKDNLLTIKYFQNHIKISFHTEVKSCSSFHEIEAMAFSEIPVGSMDYLLPVYVIKEYRRIFVPRMYLTLVALLYYIRHLNKIIKPFDSGRIPACMLSVTYSDIEDNHYHSRYAVSFKDIRTSEEEPADNNIFLNAMLEAKKI